MRPVCIASAAHMVVEQGSDVRAVAGTCSEP